MDKIVTGDVVKLKSGGAEMTVMWSNSDEAGVVWEHADGTHRTASYDLRVFEKVR